MLFPVEQAFLGRDEKRAPLKTPAWEATTHWEGRSMSRIKQCLSWFYEGWSRSQRFVNLVGNYGYVSSSVNLEANL